MWCSVHWCGALYTDDVMLCTLMMWCSVHLCGALYTDDMVLCVLMKWCFVHWWCGALSIYVVLCVLMKWCSVHWWCGALYTYNVVLITLIYQYQYLPVREIRKKLMKNSFFFWDLLKTEQYTQGTTWAYYIHVWCLTSYT